LTPSAVITCERCNQLEAFDDGFDDIPRSIQLFQEWRQGRIALQRDPKAAAAAPKPRPATPPLTLTLSQNFHEIHPINYWRKPTRNSPLLSTSPIKSALHTRPKEGEYSQKGWFRDMVQSEEAYRSPSKKFVKWVNGFGMQEPWERVLTAGDRLWFTSSASDKRLRRLQTDRVVTPKTSVSFDAQAWQGFEPHESAVKLPPLRSRKMRSHDPPVNCRG
jgi:hypothetical protein